MVKKQIFYIYDNLVDCGYGERIDIDELSLGYFASKTCLMLNTQRKDYERSDLYKTTKQLIRDVNLGEKNEGLKIKNDKDTKKRYLDLIKEYKKLNPGTRHKTADTKGKTNKFILDQILIVMLKSKSYYFETLLYVYIERGK